MNIKNDTALAKDQQVPPHAATCLWGNFYPREHYMIGGLTMIDKGAYCILHELKTC